MSALTGESLPVNVSEQDAVMSGSVNLSEVLTIEVTKPYGESTASKIIDMVRNAASRKAPAEQFITRFARYYTPIVVVLAVLIEKSILVFLILLVEWKFFVFTQKI